MRTTLTGLVLLPDYCSVAVTRKKTQQKMMKTNESYFRSWRENSNPYRCAKKLAVAAYTVTSRLPTDKYRSYIHRLTFTDWDFYRFGLLMSLVGQVTFCAIKLKSISFENWKICPFAAVWLICRKYFKISLQYKCSLKMSNFSQIYTKRTVWWQSLTTSVSENAYIFQILRLDWCLWK